MADYYGNPDHNVVGVGGAAAASGGYGGGGQQQKPQFHGGPQKSVFGASGASGSSSSNNDAGKIFVGGLSWQTTEESLRWHFEQYGPVAHVSLMKDRNTGKPRGFGFVTFQDADTVDLVMAEQHTINHKVVDVKRAQARGMAPPSIHQGEQPPQQQQQQPAATAATEASQLQQQQQQAVHEQNKVFVGGIPPQIDRDKLREIFEEFGAVRDAIVMLDQATQRSRGFGFVTFEDGTDGATKSVAAQPLPIMGRSVEVKFATPRPEQAGGAGGRQRPGPGMASNNPALGAKFLGLRAGVAGSALSSSAHPEFAGLAVAYGRNGWKAGYGSKAFGKAGWNVRGWDDGGEEPDRAGFSFDMIPTITTRGVEESPSKRPRRH